ncbi:hypothetical protein EXIGLDRAFT_613040 [Exidia glandulosa HHB12029]|uniref:Uncharacterized protein n=1 Tax=Exidia glandulosa HHB12029 TaxID=1314781 RepID=A0A165BVU5_EXIGL|nr:hypothetical protein EXIGLDRAFT_628641 [Exidia glandulosa HHB12029]KZV82559.1 hypothetical protein EXIGLDRAFT_626838 [Exidia glandulosa HHB12029]KZV93327.1 hypothetical protein EXIGLDRAFT_613040 [Exidia glandulosa HHB12029]
MPLLYSRDDTVNAVLQFYEQIIRHPHLDDSALVLPPPTGWDSITNVDGKNETVLDLLRHLPYLRPQGPYERLLVNYETIPVLHTDSHDRLGEDVYPLPAHCVYLTHSVDHLGTSLILDTNEGTITEFSHAGSHLTVPYEEYEALPETEKWKAHRTLPAAELLARWAERYDKLVWMLVPNPVRQPTTGRFYSRAEFELEEEDLVQQGLLNSWHAQDDDSNVDEDEDELDSQQRRARNAARKHVEVCAKAATRNVYYTYLRCGWPGHFDKERCAAELLELEKSRDAEERRRMDEANPDAALFD